jgi:hypothetical protein
VADIRESRLARRESVEQRIGSMVWGKYQMVIEWYRSGNEKESGKKQAEGRRKIRGR